MKRLLLASIVLFVLLMVPQIAIAEDDFYIHDVSYNSWSDDYYEIYVGLPNFRQAKTYTIEVKDSGEFNKKEVIDLDGQSDDSRCIGVDNDWVSYWPNTNKPIKMPVTITVTPDAESGLKADTMTVKAFLPLSGAAKYRNRIVLTYKTVGDAKSFWPTIDGELRSNGEGYFNVEPKDSVNTLTYEVTLPHDVDSDKYNYRAHVSSAVTINGHSRWLSTGIGLNSLAPVIPTVTLEADSNIISIGKNYPLTVTLTPENLKPNKLEFSSSDTKIADVSSKGVIVPKQAGKVTITATHVDSGEKTSIDMTIISVKVSQDKLTVALGKTARLTATLAPTDLSSSTLMFDISDESVAVVSNKGLVYPLKAGTATITVTHVLSGISATCTLTVTQ